MRFPAGERYNHRSEALIPPAFTSERLAIMLIVETHRAGETACPTKTCTCKVLVEWFWWAKRFRLPNSYTLTTLRPFVNLASEEDWRLVVSWLLATFRPTGPYPVLVIYGEQGAVWRAGRQAGWSRQPVVSMGSKSDDRKELPDVQRSHDEASGTALAHPSPSGRALPGRGTRVAPGPRIGAPRALCLAGEALCRAAYELSRHRVADERDRYRVCL